MKTNSNQVRQLENFRLLKFKKNNGNTNLQKKLLMFFFFTNTNTQVRHQKVSFDRETRVRHQNVVDIKTLAGKKRSPYYVSKEIRPHTGARKEVHSHRDRLQLHGGDASVRPRHNKYKKR